MRSRLHHLGLETPDPAVLARFYEQALGMDCADGRGRTKVCTATDRRLVLSAGQAKHLSYAAYAVKGRDALKALRHDIQKAGTAIAEGGSPLFGEAFSITDPDGTRVVFGCPDRNDTGGTLPARLQHFVMASTQCSRVAQFYEEKLGFTISDRVFRDDGSLTACFLRSDDEHHSFAVFQAPKSGFDHCCFETSGWNDIRDWGDHLAGLRIPVVWGPGRHGPGNNLFLFIEDPDGNSVEFSAELEVVPAGRPAGSWPHEQRTLNLWGRAPLRS